MKHIWFLVLVCIGGNLMAQPQSYKAAIASYEVIVEKSIRTAFQPHQEDGGSNGFVRKYYASGAPSADGKYNPFDAVLTDTCMTLLRHSLKGKKIELGDKVPKDGLLSTYTAYNYPNMGLGKAARTGLAQAYIGVEVKFSFKESLAGMKRDVYIGLNMTPHVSISIKLVDSDGRTIYNANGAATATAPIAQETISEKLQSVHTDATAFRADDDARSKMLMDLFNQALSEVMFNLK